jgi:hypothetical protein
MGLEALRWDPAREGGVITEDQWQSAWRSVQGGDAPSMQLSNWWFQAMLVEMIERGRVTRTPILYKAVKRAEEQLAMKYRTGQLRAR